MNKQEQKELIVNRVPLPVKRVRFSTYLSVSQLIQDQTIFDRRIVKRASQSGILHKNTGHPSHGTKKPAKDGKVIQAV